MCDSGLGVGPGADAYAGHPIGPDTDFDDSGPDRAARDLAEYDRFRYDNFPFRATHPDWLGYLGDADPASMTSAQLGDDAPVTDHDTLRELIDLKLERFVRAALLVDPTRVGTGVL